MCMNNVLLVERIRFVCTITALFHAHFVYRLARGEVASLSLKSQIGFLPQFACVACDATVA